MTAALTPVPKIQFFADDGTPLVGGKLYSYAAGTTTPQATYVSFAGTTANTNPVILDSRGEANVWLNTGAYKFALYDANNVLIWTVDNIVSDNVAVNLTGPNGSSLVGFLQAGTGAVATTVQAKLRESVSVKDFGATGNGTTDDTTALQAAISAAQVMGAGTKIWFPIGTYLISSTLNVTSGIFLVGENGSLNGVNGTPPAGMKTVIQWNSAVTGSNMIRWVSSTASTVINRGGIQGITLDGNNTATNGLYISSAAYTELDIVTYRTVNQGILIDDANGALSNALYIRRFEHFCGPNAATWGCNGLFIDGDVSGFFATSIVCDFMECEVINGAGLTFRAVDSCNFTRAKIYTRSGSSGTGYHVRFLTTVNYPTFYAQKNRIGMLIAGGKIYFGDYTKNNVIDCCVAEYGLINYQSAGANKRANHVTRLIDFRTDASWNTHQFRLTDYASIPLGDFVAFGTTATLTTCGSLSAGRGWSFSAAATNGISASNVVPLDWGNGFLRGVRLTLQSVGAATGNVVMQVAGVARSNTNAIGGFQQTIQATLAPAQSVTSTLTQYEVLFSAEIVSYLYGWWCISLERLGADAADTYPNAVVVVGVELMYRGKGPDSAASYGPYELTLIGGSDANP
jgi:hypothetical protein